MRIIYVLFSFVLLLTSALHAQELTTGENRIPNDLSKQLPALDALIDSAMLHSPAVKLAESDIILSGYDQRLSNRSWLSYLFIQGDGRYGSEYFINQDNILSSMYYMNDKPRMIYGLGLNIRMPLSELFNRKIASNKAQIGVEQANLKKEEVTQALRQLVIIKYHELLLKQKSLEIRREAMEVADMQLDMAQLGFKNNKIPIEDYTQASQVATKARLEYEVEKSEFTVALLLLEDIVGIKFFK